jgi:3-hydroxyisobutyrate dehydrogenase-like beta-hydroxyacid dehydrogenase
MDIGFIGLGNMGLPMAKNLVDAGYDVRGFDVADERLEQFGEAGGTAAADVTDAVEGAEIVVTMVRTPEQVKIIIEEAFTAMDTDALYIDMSTIGPKATGEVRDAAEAEGIEMVDAPVSGGVPGSEGGTLAIMAGGTAQAFERAEELFDVLGSNVYHVGPPDAGQMAKMCLQTLVGAEIASICEAFWMAEAADIDLETLYGVLTDSIGTSGILEVKGDLILDGDFSDPTGDLTLQRKDMELVMDTAKDLDIPMYTTAAVTQEYRHAVAEGLGEKDQFALYELLK